MDVILVKFTTILFTFSLAMGDWVILRRTISSADTLGQQSTVLFPHQVVGISRVLMIVVVPTIPLGMAVALLPASVPTFLMRCVAVFALALWAKLNFRWLAEIGTEAVKWQTEPLLHNRRSLMVGWQILLMIRQAASVTAFMVFLYACA